MLQAFKDGKYTDLMIVCSLDDTEFHAHKIILCTQSKFFAKACDGSSDNGFENIVHISDFEGRTVSKVFEFLYSGEYSLYDVDDSEVPDETDDISRENDIYRKKIKSEVQTHIDVLRAAEALQIAELSAHTERLIIEFIESRMDEIFLHSDYFFITILRMIIRDGQSDPIIESVGRALSCQIDLLMDKDSLAYYRRELIELLGSMGGKLAFTLLERFLMPRILACPGGRGRRKRGFVNGVEGEEWKPEHHHHH